MTFGHARWKKLVRNRLSTPKIRPESLSTSRSPAKKAKSMRFKSRLLPSSAHSQKPRLIYLVFYKSAHLALPPFQVKAHTFGDFGQPRRLIPANTRPPGRQPSNHAIREQPKPPLAERGPPVIRQSSEIKPPGLLPRQSTLPAGKRVQHAAENISWEPMNEWAVRHFAIAALRAENAFDETVWT